MLALRSDARLHTVPVQMPMYDNYDHNIINISRGEFFSIGPYFRICRYEPLQAGLLGKTHNPQVASV